MLLLIALGYDKLARIGHRKKSICQRSVEQNERTENNPLRIDSMYESAVAACEPGPRCHLYSINHCNFGLGKIRTISRLRT